MKRLIIAVGAVMASAVPAGLDRVISSARRLSTSGFSRYNPCPLLPVHQYHEATDHAGESASFVRMRPGCGQHQSWAPGESGRDHRVHGHAPDPHAERDEIRPSLRALPCSRFRRGGVAFRL